MKRRLFLHIGAGKCASSSIQRFLMRNVAALNKNGIGLANADFTFDRAGGTPGPWLFSDDVSIEARRAEIEARIADAPYDTLLASAETLANPRGASLFAGIQEQLDVRVLYVIRRPEDWIFSAWKQWWHREGRSLDDFLEFALTEPRPDFLGNTVAWRDAVGAPAVEVVPLDLVPSDYGIERTVLDWIGLDADGFDLETGRANPSLDGRVAAFLSGFPEVYRDRHDTAIDRALSKHSALALSSPGPALSPEARARVRARFDGDLVELLGPERASEVQARPIRQADPGQGDVDDRAFVLACLVEALGSLGEESRTLRKTVDDLTQRLAVAEGTVPDIRAVRGPVASDLEAVRKRHAAQLAAERAKLWHAVTHPWRTYRAGVDYRIHKSLSKWRFLPTAMRDRMARGAAKRKAAILGAPAGSPA